MTNIIIGPVRAGRQTTCVICKEQIRYGNPNRFGTGQRILPVALVNQNGSPKPGKPMICPKPAFVPLPVTHTNEWAPNRLPMITLPCGCRDIPWPLVHCLGDNFATMTCEKHGLQKLTKTWKKKAKTQAKKLSKIPAEQQLDIPPF